MTARGLVVVGTDTGVGKTVVSALLLARYPYRTLYWKPVATGAREERDVEFVRDCVGDRVLEEEYLFDPPVSPHLAARRAGVTIDLERLRAAFRGAARGGAVALVVEGAGGLLVPLTDRGDLQVDFLASLGLPFLLVARTALGTMNHTLLSLEALEKRGARVAGVVLNGPRQPAVREAVERFGGARVIAEVPSLSRGKPTRSALLAAARRFDREGALERHLTPRRARVAR